MSNASGILSVLDLVSLACLEGSESLKNTFIDRVRFYDNNCVMEMLQLAAIYPAYKMFTTYILSLVGIP